MANTKTVRRPPIAWLDDSDGITDGIAIQIVVKGWRPNTPPALTKWEAAIAVELMVDHGIPHRIIAQRTGLSGQKADEWAGASRKGTLYDIVREIE